MKNLNLPLSASREPKYRRIYDAFVEALKAGTLKPGDQIPSTRELAKVYRCHRLTVMTAMQSLVAEGWIEAKEKAHYFVSDKTPIITSQKAKASKDKTPEFEIVRPLISLNAERARYKIEFWGGQPDLRLFPKEEFRRITSDAIKKIKPDLLSYGLIDGLAPLKTQVTEYFRRTRSLTGRQILVTNGSQEAIYLVASSLLRPGDAVVVEEKGYNPVWKIFENLGAKLVPIPVDAEGLSTDHLAKTLGKQKIKLLYTTPLHQYPTTVTLSPRRRRALIELIEKHKVPTLEDDYDHEFHYLSPPPAPLSVETRYGIYVASFSKIIFPGARLGVVACDPVLYESLAVQKYLISRQTDSLIQMALALWIQDGGFERHLRRTLRAYEKRYYCLLEELTKIQKVHDIEWQQPNGGMSIWVNLKRNSRLIAEKAMKQDVFFQNEKDMDFKGKDGTHLRIGFAGVNENEIRAGMKVLSNILSYL